MDARAPVRRLLDALAAAEARLRSAIEKADAVSKDAQATADAALRRAEEALERAEADLLAAPAAGMACVAAKLERALEGQDWRYVSSALGDVRAPRRPPGLVAEALATGDWRGVDAALREGRRPRYTMVGTLS